MSRRRDLISFELRTVTQNALNEDVESWAAAFSEYAEVFYGSGSEQRAAAQVRGVQGASFEVLDNERTRAVTTADHRIVFDGGIWNITARTPVSGKRRQRITAVRDVP